MDPLPFDFQKPQDIDQQTMMTRKEIGCTTRDQSQLGGNYNGNVTQLFLTNTVQNSTDTTHHKK